MQYEERLHRIPGVFEKLDLGRMQSSGGVPNTTWSVILLPGLERQDIYDNNAAGMMKGTYVEIYLCPSDADKNRSGPVTSYVANGGRVGSVFFERVQNGAFLHRIYRPDAATLDGHWADGREYTLIYTENNDAKYYDEVGWNGFKPNELWKLDSKFIVEDHDDRTWNPVFLWSDGKNSDDLQTRINMPALICHRLNATKRFPAVTPADLAATRPEKRSPLGLVHRATTMVA